MFSLSKSFIILFFTLLSYYTNLVIPSQFLVVLQPLPLFLCIDITTLALSNILSIHPDITYLLSTTPPLPFLQVS
jgi:hypothetical protein